MRNNYKSKITKLLVLTIFGFTLPPIYNTSALNYKNNIGIGFTFNPSLSLSISSSDLVIDNLTPGTTADSNDITISVATNAAYGYILTTSAGNSTIYNNTDLIRGNSNNIFSSIPTNVNLSSLEDSSHNNIWGYSYKLSGNNTWSNYSGLPLYSNPLKVLLNIDSNDEVNSSIDFKIAAKASSAQVSGEYNNVINFSAITKPTPTTLAEAYANYYQAANRTMHNGYYVMQDMADSHICENTEVIGSELQVIDIRDDKVYWIAKLADGKCWMTQNLDLTGGTELSSENTDFNSSYTIPDTQGWQPGNKLPTSSTNGFTVNNYAYVYNSNRTECSAPGCYSYYSWDTATLGSGKNITTENADAPYSICPKGWKLPDTKSPAAQNWQKSDFYLLATAYKMSSNKLLQPNTPNFTLSGNYYNGRFYSGDGGIYGYYWSSTGYNTNNAFLLAIGSSSTQPYYSEYRKNGYAVRCLAK